MNIAIIGSRGYPYVYSGYETFVAELAPRLTKKGHEVTVYCHKALFSDRPPSVNGIHLCYVPAVELKNLSQFTHSLFSTLHVLFTNVDAILYVNSANGPFGLLTKLFGKRTAINVDGLEWLRPKWKGLGVKYFRMASYLATKLFDVVISDSERMAEVYKREFNAQSTTIAYGANIGYRSDVNRILDLGLQPNDYYLVVGRLIPDNNSDIIVKGFERSQTTRKLVILGDVPYKDRFAETVRRTEDKRIQFLGYIRDQELLRELFCNCYAYVHGHEFGGTNPSLLMALANGCCVLALDTVFNREVLLDETHGRYFTKAAASVETLISKIESEDALVQSLRGRARERITSNYSWEKIADQYETLLTALVSR